MSARPTVSVVMPAYNAEAFVVEAVESALAQTVDILEVIVVNDGSSDRTEELLQSFGDRITLITQKNKGCAGARNTGLEHVRGDYIAFLDADDAWLPEKTERQLDVLERYPDIAAVGSVCFEFDPEGRVIAAVKSEPSGKAFWISRDPPLIDMSDIGDNLMRNTLGAPSGLIVRRACMEEMQMFDGSLRDGSEDWDLYIRLACKYRIAVYADQLFRYRITEGSMCAPKNTEKMLRSNLMVLDKIFGKSIVPASWWQRRKSYGNCYFKNSQAFKEAGQFSRARSALFKAIMYWPTVLFTRYTLFMLIALAMGENWIRRRQAAKP